MEIKTRFKTIFLFILLFLGVSHFAFAVSLTSITLDPEDSTGTTTNAPGAWSTNTADPLSQVGVMSNGVFLNNGAASGNLGEISIPLKHGINIFTLFGNGTFQTNAFYGAVLFFDGVPTPPQIAVYNTNGFLGSFLVQPAGTTIMGGANGGLFFDKAPGTHIYIAPDGTKVEVLSFVINSMCSNVDKISFANIGPDGTFDTTAQLILRVTHSNAPPVCSKAASSLTEIWPPNHKMTDIEIVGVTDPDDDSIDITINSITQDEPVKGKSDKTAPDGDGVDTSAAQVRAERNGNGNGRVYEISFVASDNRGGECEGSVKVCVPHDMRPNHNCVDDGQNYDSTQP
jgi:hypothetical protein